MKIKEMDALIKHFDKYFEQSDCRVLHPIVDDGFHIDILMYKPSQKYPFWKFVTMGASDYRMPETSKTLGLFNEYIMFIDQDEDLEDEEVLSWYHCNLLNVATFAYYNKTHITYGHSFEWKNESPDDEMIAAFIELPQVIENADVVRCKMSMFKTIVCLQVVLLNKEELSNLMKIGPHAFSEYLYPENGSARHFLSQRHRTAKF